MPTGYTEFLQKHSDATLADFAWKCARAMGFCIMQRDDAWDAPIEMDEKISDYHNGRLTELRDERMKVADMTDAEWDALHAKKAAESQERWREDDRKRRETVATYQSMLDKVEAWACPPELSGMKEFMASQLTESIRFDGPHEADDFTARIYGYKPMTREEKLSDLARDITYHEKQLAEEVERVEGRNRYKRLLLESVGKPNLVTLSQ